MIFKKIMKGAVVSALALVAAGTLTISASATEGEGTEAATKGTKPATATFYGGRSMTVTPGADDYKGTGSQILVAYPKVDRNGNVKVKEWDAYNLDNGEAKVLLNHVKTTKESYVAVRTNTCTAASLYKIPEDKAKVKAKFEVKEIGGVLKAAVNVTTKSGASSTTVDDWNVTIGDSSSGSTEYGTTLADFIAGDGFADFQQQGATLYLTVKGSIGPKKTNTEAIEVLAGDWAKDIKGAYTCYDVAGTFDSTPVKVKIPKLASAPKVKPDYNKLSIKVSDKQEFRYYTYDGTVNHPWTVGTKSAVSIEDVASMGDGVFEIRTKEDGSKAKKKLASKVGRFDFCKVEAPTPIKDTAEDSATGKKLSDLAITLGAEKKGTTTKCSITATNSSKETSYTVTIVGAKNGKDVVKTVKADTKDVSLLSCTGEPKYEIKVSVAGDKKTGKLASASASLGKIGDKAEETTTSDAAD